MPSVQAMISSTHSDVRNISLPPSCVLILLGHGEILNILGIQSIPHMLTMYGAWPLTLYMVSMCGICMAKLLYCVVCFVSKYIQDQDLHMAYQHMGTRGKEADGCKHRCALVQLHTCEHSPPSGSLNTN